MEINGGIGGCDLLVNRNDAVVAGAIPMSPWKTSDAAATPVTGVDLESWPALTDAQRSKNNGSVDLNSTKPLLPPAQAKADVSGPPPPATPAQVEQKKFHGRGNNKSPHRPYSLNQNKTGGKHVPYSVPPPFSGTFPYQPPAVMPYFPPMGPIPPVSASGYAYPFPPGTFPRPDARPGKSGTDQVPSYLPPQNGSSAGGRPSIKEQHGQMNPSWNTQRPVASNNYHVQQTIFPTPFMGPPFIGSTGFVDGPNFPGPLGTVYYYHAPPPGSIRGSYSQFLPQYPLNPRVPRQPSPTKALRDRILMQIEYYFSDKNLQNDHHLKSLMDNQGWVSIAIISNFKKVKEMKTDIPFILDTLKASETIEVKGEKVRRRHEWSKWVLNPTSKSLSPVRNKINNPDHDESKRDSSEGKLEPSSPNGYSDGLLQVKDLSSGEAPKVDLENSNSSVTLGFQLDNGNDCSVLSNESDCKPAFPKHCESSSPIVKNLDDTVKYISSTLVLDEDLELEQTTRNNHPSMERVDDEDDDEGFVNDQDIERLVIVTQNSPTSEGPGDASKIISSDLASMINDGLYFYEQELNSKMSQRRLNGPVNESRGENHKYSDSNGATQNSRAIDHTGELSNSEGPGNSNSNHGSSKQHLIHKQRLFCANFKAHGAISESPSTDAVGFFFGSTPQDSHGPSKFSPPVGLVSKPFSSSQDSQHLIHKLLQENGFQQQLYKKYQKFSLSERKKMGIGRSEEMNALYRFWCYFLRGMFIPSMYNEFKMLALEDASANYNYGIECLFRFYSYSLEMEFKEDLYEDFEQLTQNLYKSGNPYGLEKYWAFHQDREGRGQTESLKKHPELDRLLREEYKSFDDFNPAKADNST